MADFLRLSRWIHTGPDAWIERLDQALVGASIGMLLLACGIITCCVAYLLHTGLVDLSLASYSPLTNRILFGNKQYQQLFDRANQYMPKKRSTPSLGI